MNRGHATSKCANTTPERRAAGRGNILAHVWLDELAALLRSWRYGRKRANGVSVRIERGGWWESERLHCRTTFKHGALQGINFSTKLVILKLRGTEFLTNSFNKLVPVGDMRFQRGDIL